MPTYGQVSRPEAAATAIRTIGQLIPVDWANSNALRVNAICGEGERRRGALCRVSEIAGEAALFIRHIYINALPYGVSKNRAQLFFIVFKKSL